MKVKLVFAMVFCLVLAFPVVADEWDLKGYSWAIVVDHDVVDIAVGDSIQSHRRIDKVSKSFDEPFVWVKRGHSEWVITDPEIVSRLRNIMESPELDGAQERMEADRLEIEESVRQVESRVREMERQLDRVSMEEAKRIAEAAREIDHEQLEVATERIERGVRELERAIAALKHRVEGEAVPLIEKSISEGKATKVR